MTESSSQSARRQFGRQAAYYVQSQVHATGDTLQALVDLAQPRPTEAGPPFRGASLLNRQGRTSSLDNNIWAKRLLTCTIYSGNLRLKTTSAT